METTHEYASPIISPCQATAFLKEKEGKDALKGIKSTETKEVQRQVLAYLSVFHSCNTGKTWENGAASSYCSEFLLYVPHLSLASAKSRSLLLTQCGCRKPRAKAKAKTLGFFFFFWIFSSFSCLFVEMC